jgi:heme/copper-type cytochrome/quinol oxidase subunit 1
MGAPKRFSWGRLWVPAAVVVAVVLAAGLILQLLDINLFTTLFPVSPDDPEPYG